ncbi:MAG: SRPBCC domain-containing protein, partial [Terriglobales bacterium]
MEKMGEIVNSHTVRIERLLPGPIERVWDYLTRPDLVATWLMDCTIEPELGGLISLKSNPIPEGTIENDQQAPHETFIRGFISEFAPPRLIAFSWNKPDYNLASCFRAELE